MPVSDVDDKGGNRDERDRDGHRASPLSAVVTAVGALAGTPRLAPRPAAPSAALPAGDIGAMAGGIFACDHVAYPAHLSVSSLLSAGRRIPTRSRRANASD